MGDLNKERTCPKCKHVQVVKEENVHQDIGGKFIVCVKCNGFIDVEFE